MPRIVQWSRFSDAFTKLFGLQGASSLNVIDDVFLMLPVEPELLHLDVLRSWRPFFTVVNQAAVAGQFAGAQLQAAPGALVVIDGFTLTGSVANQQVNIGSITTAALAAGAFLGVGCRDSRLVDFSAGGVNAHRAPLGVSPVSNAAAILPPSGSALMRLVAGPPGFPTTPNPIPFVIANGATLMFENNVLNLELTVSVWGRYRELTQQESTR